MRVSALHPAEILAAGKSGKREIRRRIVFECDADANRRPGTGMVADI